MALLPSKRAHLYVLERARVIVRDGRVEYISDEGREPRGFNIPVANTSFLMIGPGSSITNEAVRALKSDGVCVGFCGSGGTPLLSAQDPYPDFLLPADEYREPRYLQQWMEIWRDDATRLKAAKCFLLARLEQIERCWTRLDFGAPMPDPPSTRQRRKFAQDVEDAATTAELLGFEGQFAKDLYRILAQSFAFPDFQRQPRGGKSTSDPNTLLDQGNYLAYGLASVVLWVLGIPAALAALHGKTRRGALVFDLADVIKDAIILPMAFAMASRAQSGEAVDQTEFRNACVAAFDDARALEVLFTAMTETIAACSS